MTDHESRPDPFQISSWAASVARNLTTRSSTKKHGGYLHYEDEVIHISLDTYVPNLGISIIRDGQHIPVFSASHHSHGKPQRYNPGSWVQYLQSLVPKAQTADAERRQAQAEQEAAHKVQQYGPVDDLTIFADRV